MAVILGALALLVSVLVLAGAGLFVWQSFASAKPPDSSPSAVAAKGRSVTTTHRTSSSANPNASVGPPRAAAPAVAATTTTPRATSPGARSESASGAPTSPPAETPRTSDGTITVAESSPRKVNVWIGNSAVTRGPYDSAALASGVARGYGPVRACYVAILEEYDGAAGTLNMRMSITPEGQARAVGWMGTSSSVPTNLGTCINRAYLALTFPSHPGPSWVEATFQIRLSTSG